MPGPSNRKGKRKATGQKKGQSSAKAPVVKSNPQQLPQQQQNQSQPVEQPRSPSPQPPQPQPQEPAPAKNEPAQPPPSNAPPAPRRGRARSNSQTMNIGKSVVLRSMPIGSSLLDTWGKPRGLKPRSHGREQIIAEREENEPETPTARHHSEDHSKVVAVEHCAPRYNEGRMSSSPSRGEDSSPTSSSPLLTPSPGLDPYTHAHLPPFLHWDLDDSEWSIGDEHHRSIGSERQKEIEETLNKPPFIHDPGNGPRVRDAKAFLESRFFAQAPALNIPMCAEFAQEEVLQMLMTVLPDETARILWYNKSRATSRVCPACQRLYRLGDILPDHLSDAQEQSQHKQSPYLYKEQEISGLCSPVCFILASFTFPSAIKLTWGRLAPDISDEGWALLNAPVIAKPHASAAQSQALGMLVRMTRLHDLGLAQLCLDPEADTNEEVDILDSAPPPSMFTSALQNATSKIQNLNLSLPA